MLFDVSLPVSFVGHPFSHPSYQSPVAFEDTGDLLLLPEVVPNL